LKEHEQEKEERSVSEASSKDKPTADEVPEVSVDPKNDKFFLYSKELWTLIIAAIVLGIQKQYGFVIDPQWQLIIVGLIIAILRAFVTRTNLTLRRPEKKTA
jgi:hypothetical protein